MTQFDFDWETTDALTLRGKCWLPEGGQPKALLCLVHGFGEHIGRYEHVAQFFNENQIGLIGFDLRGHGKSDGKRGVTPSYDALMVNIGEFLSLAKEKFSGIPLFLYGHSMGGNLVANFIIQSQPEFLQGSIITSPWFELAFPPPALKVAIGKFIGKFFPSFTNSTALTLTELSSDLDVGRAYLKDPLVHNKMSAALFTGVSEAGEYALADAENFKIPLLLMHGASDKITSADASQRFAANLKNEHEWVLWERMRHELQNEVEKEKVLGKIVEWVLRNIK